jgi:hypothetical protein
MDETGWHLNPTFSKEEVITIYEIYRKLILDGELPVAKVAGFRIVSGSGLKRQSAGVIFKCHESLFEIINHLQDVVFFPLENNIDTLTELSFGDVTTDTLTSNTLPNNLLKPLTHNYLFHMTASTQLILRIHTGRGIVSAKDNHNAFTDQSLIPVMSDHSLVKYVNIMYVDDHTIRHKIHNGLSFENYKKLFDSYLYKSAESTKHEVIYEVDAIFDMLYDRCSKFVTKAVEPMHKAFVEKLVTLPPYNMYRRQGDTKGLSRLQYILFKNMFISANKKETIDHLHFDYGFTDKASEAIAQVLHEYV